MDTHTTTRPRLAHLERWLVGLEVFLAVGAFVGAVGLVTGGVDLGEAVADLPFQSPVFGGIALAIINGALPTAVAVGALLHRPWARAGHLVVGTALVGWIVVQVAFIGFGSWLQATYLALGLVIQALALALLQQDQPTGDTTATVLSP